MTRITRIILLPLILASIIVLFSATGCATTGNIPAGTGTTTAAVQGEMSQPELQKILADSIAVYKDINTYKFDVNTDIFTDVTGGSQAGKMTINSVMSGTTNLASKQMQMSMFMDAEGTEAQGGSQSLTYDMYLLSDWVYMKVTMIGIDEQWVKMPVTDELNQSFDLNIVKQQMESLNSPVKIELLRYEKVEGLDYYVLSVVPDPAELKQWLSQQQSNGQDIDWINLANLADIFKKTEYICYIVKDTKLLKKMTTDMVMEFTSEQAGTSAGSFDKMTMEIKTDMKLYDHNIPFSVNLPADAKNAKEVSGDIPAN